MQMAAVPLTQPNGAATSFWHFMNHPRRWKTFGKASVDVWPLSESSIAMSRQDRVHATTATAHCAPGMVQEWRAPPYWLTWLRFTAFLVLYPMGVASEIAMVRLAYPAISQQRTFCVEMPNALNFGVDYPLCCLLLTFLYLPGKRPSNHILASRS